MQDLCKNRRVPVPMEALFYLLLERALQAYDVDAALDGFKGRLNSFVDSEISVASLYGNFWRSCPCMRWQLNLADQLRKVHQ